MITAITADVEYRINNMSKLPEWELLLNEAANAFELGGNNPTITEPLESYMWRAEAAARETCGVKEHRGALRDFLAASDALDEFSGHTSNIHEVSRTWLSTFPIANNV